jgi:hypothetical protein
MSVIKLPSKEDLATGSSEWVTGQLSYVTPQQGQVSAVYINDETNPGLYPFASSVAGGLEAALVALANKLVVGASLYNGEIVAFFVTA